MRTRSFAMFLVFLASCGSAHQPQSGTGDTLDSATTDRPDIPGPSPDAVDACVPQCEFRRCGQDDGCGGKCLRCPENATCNTTSWVCDCPGVWCGDNCCAPGQQCLPSGE